MPLHPGTKLGAYEVKEVIGQGAMGTVYLARHEALDRTAAVKVMRGLEDDPAAAARFRREGQAIALLRHTNILTVYDFGEYEGAPYMIVEYVPGGSLATRMKADGRMSNATIVPLLRQIAAGLDYAHEMGVVHRDVKPANVLMGRADAPVIADFGLAKLSQQATMTAYGVATGTPAYMAPEQISDGEVGPAADLYALATMAYEMLTGRLPYESDSVMQLLLSKMRDEPVPPTKRDPSVPSRVDWVLMRGLARKPEARWKSCGAMVEALASIIEPKTDLVDTTQPIRAPNTMTRLRSVNWRRWAWTPLPAIAVAALLVVFVIEPRLKHASVPGPGGPVVVACPEVSPSPAQVAASPNPAPAGSPVGYTGSGFEAGVPLFVVIDTSGDCSNPTAGALVYSTTAYTEPLAAPPSPLPASVTPGNYYLRACNHSPGKDPTNCVQIPFSVTAGPSPSASPTPSPSPTESPSPSESPSPT